MSLVNAKGQGYIHRLKMMIEYPIKNYQLKNSLSKSSSE